MRRYAELLALRHDCARTRHSYYRAMRVLHEHFLADPSTLGEDEFRDYILYVKTRKHRNIWQTVEKMGVHLQPVANRKWHPSSESSPAGRVGKSGASTTPHPKDARAPQSQQLTTQLPTKKPGPQSAPSA